MTIGLAQTTAISGVQWVLHLKQCLYGVMRNYLQEGLKTDGWELGVHCIVMQLDPEIYSTQVRMLL